jgi:hypothetical protein
LHFSGWNAIKHDVFHFSSLSRSDWSVLASWSDEIVKYVMFVGIPWIWYFKMLA